MAFEIINLTANPGLLILLTDGLEESVKLVNDIIDYLIQLNFNGAEPINHCNLIVLGYKKEVKALCSGWLRNLDESPKRIVSAIKKIHYGAGDFIDIVVKQPIGGDPSTTRQFFQIISILSN